MSGLLFPSRYRVRGIKRKLIGSIWLAQQKAGYCARSAASWADAWGKSQRVIELHLSELTADGVIENTAAKGAPPSRRVVIEVLNRIAATHPKVSAPAPADEHAAQPADEHAVQPTAEPAGDAYRVNARALPSPTQPNPMSAVSTVPDSLPDGAGLPLIHNLPANLFRTPAAALEFLKRRHPGALKHRKVWSIANQVLDFTRGKPDACRWYTALGVMWLPMDRNPDGTIRGTIRDLKHGDPEAPDGIRCSGLQVAAFRAILESEIPEQAIAHFGGDIYTAALEPIEVLRSWIAQNTPKYEPPPGFDEALDYALKHMTFRDLPEPPNE